jgi:hypothetical protein
MDTQKSRVQGIHVMSARHAHMLRIAEVELAHPQWREHAMWLEQELVALLRKEPRV